MRERERRYLERIEEIIERFGSIQRDLVLDQSGIHAIVEFIEKFSGSIPEFPLNDPVLLKGKQAAFKVIGKLEEQLEELKSLEPPALWSQFHEVFVSSISTQLDGYREMVQVFNDRDTSHITRGRSTVDEGVSRLEGGSRGTWLFTK